MHDVLKKENCGNTGTWENLNHKKNISHNITQKRKEMCKLAPTQ